MNDLYIQISYIISCIQETTEKNIKMKNEFG